MQPLCAAAWLPACHRSCWVDGQMDALILDGLSDFKGVMLPGPGAVLRP